MPLQSAERRITFSSINITRLRTVILMGSFGSFGDNTSSSDFTLLLSFFHPCIMVYDLGLMYSCVCVRDRWVYNSCEEAVKYRYGTCRPTCNISLTIP